MDRQTSTSLKQMDRYNSPEANGQADGQTDVERPEADGWTDRRQKARGRQMDRQTDINRIETDINRPAADRRTEVNRPKTDEKIDVNRTKTDAYTLHLIYWDGKIIFEQTEGSFETEKKRKKTISMS